MLAKISRSVRSGATVSAASFNRCDRNENKRTRVDRYHFNQLASAISFSFSNALGHVFWK
jgi:hypothetical protein